MKRTIASALFMACSLVFANENINVDYLGRPLEYNGIPISYSGSAQPCIPMCVYDELEEFAIDGGAIIYFDGTHMWNLENFISTNKPKVADYISTNKLFKSDDFVSTNYMQFDWNDEYLVSRITWVYKDFDDNVTVTFDIDGLDFSETTRQLLAEEIAKAIQDIIDLHFLKDKEQ